MKEKKPIYKKWWFWVIAFLLFSIFWGAAHGNTPSQQEIASSEASKEKSVETPTEATAETADPQEELREALKEKVYISFSPNVMKDVTGRWRLGKYAEFISQEDLAVEYYKAYFTSDDEIHYLINFSTMTTARIKKISEDKLEVYITEYVDKEEFDAGLLGSGMELGQYFVTISTGEVEKIEG